MELFFQIEPPKVDVRCREHLPEGAVVVETEDARQRKVGSWLRASDTGTPTPDKPAYHSSHRCLVCKEPWDVTEKKAVTDSERIAALDKRSRRWAEDAEVKNNPDHINHKLQWLLSLVNKYRTTLGLKDDQ